MFPPISVLLGLERGFKTPLLQHPSTSVFPAAVKVEEDQATALPIPLQLKFYNWGQGGTAKYFHATQVIVANLPYHGPYKASVHSHIPDSWVPSVDLANSSGPGDQNQNLEPQPSPPRRWISSQPHQLFQRNVSFYDSHSTTQKNGETPSPSTLHVSGTYFHYPSPDSDVPSRSISTLPHLEFSRNLPHSFLTTATTSSIHLLPSVSPSPRVATRSSPIPPPFINVQDYPRLSPSRFSRRFSHSNRSPRTGTRNGHSQQPQQYRRATVHGGRGKPHLERQRKYYQTGLPSTFTHRHPQVQTTLRTVGIDDDTILRRDKRIRVACCRVDARYCFLVYRLIYMLSCFEEVFIILYFFLLSLH